MTIGVSTEISRPWWSLIRFLAGLILDHAIGVDHEQPAQGHPLRLEEHAVGPADRPVGVAGQGERQPTEPPLPARCRDPGLVRLHRVATDPEQRAAMTPELLGPV